MDFNTTAFIADYTTKGYHGTSREAAASIKTSNFSLSRGDDHWLGVGAYFFEEGISNASENAEYWAKVSAWNNSQKTYEYDVYNVLKVPICFKRIWDLCSREGLELFEYARRQLTQKRKLRPTESASGRKFDNSVIEFTANLHGFDGLRSWFFIKLDKQSRVLAVKPGIPNVTVLCARNPQDSILLDEIEILKEGYVSR